VALGGVLAGRAMEREAAREILRLICTGVDPPVVVCRTTITPAGINRLAAAVFDAAHLPVREPPARRAWAGRIGARSEYADRLVPTPH
jgi:hypothetical protein